MATEKGRGAGKEQQENIDKTTSTGDSQQIQPINIAQASSATSATTSTGQEGTTPPTTQIPTAQTIYQASETETSPPSPSQQQQLSTTPSSRHQVIAVSASKGPAAFFNLARKFLVTDEFCDLSALEGAIVSAVDAAHLLERSKLADIVRIQTSYVPVEPKRRSQVPTEGGAAPHEGHQPAVAAVVAAAVGTAGTATLTPTQSQQQPLSTKPGGAKKLHEGRKGTPLRRSRIIITVKRTEDYKRWLDDNPHHSATAGDDIEVVSTPPPLPSS